MKAEDEQLRALVTRFGEQNWNLVSSHMSNRTARQCRERYKNYLSPIYRNNPWTAEEEMLLGEKVRELGQKWSAIARFFEGRSDVNVKNHWAAIQSRNERVLKAKLDNQRGEDEIEGLWGLPTFSFATEEADFFA
jgi:hypothetical protein